MPCLPIQPLSIRSLAWICQSFCANKVESQAQTAGRRCRELTLCFRSSRFAASLASPASHQRIERSHMCGSNVYQGCRVWAAAVPESISVLASSKMFLASAKSSHFWVPSCGREGCLAMFGWTAWRAFELLRKTMQL